jgi:hypothetical protein
MKRFFLLALLLFVACSDKHGSGVTGPAASIGHNEDKGYNIHFVSGGNDGDWFRIYGPNGKEIPLELALSRCDTCGIFDSSHPQYVNKVWCVGDSIKDGASVDTLYLEIRMLFPVTESWLIADISNDPEEWQHEKQMYPNSVGIYAVNIPLTSAYVDPGDSVIYWRISGFAMHYQHLCGPPSYYASWGHQRLDFSKVGVNSWDEPLPITPPPPPGHGKDPQIED